MSYIGNTPAENYASFLTETFSVSATANYTLSHAVSNENDIRLVINNVVQQPGSGKAYTASGTTLTLTSATSSGDVMYAVYLGRALQTVNPPASSVGNSQTAPTIITGQTAETSIADGDTILIHDASASALKKMTKANFVSGIGGVNTPAFEAYLASTQVISNTTVTKVNINTERFDTANAYDNSSNYRFTPQTAGKYFVYAHLNLQTNGKKLANAIPSIKKNGSGYTQSASNFANNTTSTIAIGITNIITMNGSSDYLELFAYIEVFDGAEARITPEVAGSYFGAYKIIE
tara:strand:+ start:236 stop:1108 length:873 start_codon:yes stop_codon:yes gene_type:complete